MAPTILKGNSFAQPNRADVRAKALELSRNSLSPGKASGTRNRGRENMGNQPDTGLPGSMARKSDPSI